MEQPKVRFSQTSDSVIRQKPTESTNINKGKVKVKSIVPINIPIKVLENGKKILLKDKKTSNALNSSSSNIPCIYVSDNEDSLMESRDLSTTSSDTLTDKNYRRSFPETAKEKRNYDNSISDSIEKLQRMTIQDSINKSTARKIEEKNKYKNNKSSSVLNKKNVPCITCDDSDENNDIEIIKEINTSKKLKNTQKKNIVNNIDSKKKSINNRKLNKTPQKEDKENHSKVTMSNKVQDKVPASSTKILKEANSASSMTIKRNPIKKPIKVQKKVQLMPCAKHKLASLTKSKSVEKLPQTKVKKSAVFNVAGNQRKVSVEPEILQEKMNDENSDNDLELSERQNIVSKNLLSRPEYNSTICVIKKLKEIEKEKYITDIDHLPTSYKNLLYGKVSNALDFGPYETVYKDLINLSVHDDKLPVRLMRSKDPEPRNKDIVPKLTDFYNPKYTEQYFTVANPIAMNPTSVNTLSAFTISNKIYTWKMSRDNF